MIGQSRVLQTFCEVLLDTRVQAELKYNYLVILANSTQTQFVVSLILDGQLRILLQPINVTKETFFRQIVSLLCEKSTPRQFLISETDERKLAQIYRELHIHELKDWFMRTPKRFDRSYMLKPDKDIISTLSFELEVYNQTERRRSKDFYFIELLLQFLEKKIGWFTSSRVNKNPVGQSMKVLLSETDYTLCFSHTFPASNQEYGDYSILTKVLQQKLSNKGITKLYTFQIEVAQSILEQKNVVITAPTGNGKTESFLLPILQKTMDWKREGIKGIKVILFYPTKALASDQLSKIKFFIKDTGINFIQLDSDVAQTDRKDIYASRDYDILITTPDLIHYSLQKNKFKKFIAGTKIIVFDEIHIYTGSFGTHVYFFLRRLERVLDAGLQVQYIAASATIANPVEFTSKLFQRKMIHVDCKTPKKNVTELYCIQRNKTTSSYDALFQLLIMLTQAQDEKIIIFRNSQQECEKTFEKLRLIKNKKIALHRAGLTRGQRMIIEKQLRNNRIDVVVTTTTLEVGIDIGGITTIITPIVPVNRLLQRIGRAGRGNKPAKIFLELGHDPISYYYATHADSYLQDISPVNITTENESIALLHEQLEQQKPGTIFSLRNVNEGIEVRTEYGYKVTKKELPYAFYEYYPFAQIMHNSKVYKVERMERKSKGKITAIVRPTGEKYNYKLKIKPIIEKKVFTNTQSVSIDYIDNIEVKLSECKVQLEYQGNLINFKEQVLANSYTYEYTSKCVIFNFEDLTDELVQEEREKGVELGSIVHTLSHVLYNAARMKIFCGNDLTNLENSIGRWKIIFVDNAINGNGMSELFYEKRDEVWKRAKEILKDCKCRKQEGCIRCTMDYSCQIKNNNLIKKIPEF